MFSIYYKVLGFISLGFSLISFPLARGFDSNGRMTRVCKRNGSERCERKGILSRSFQKSDLHTFVIVLKFIIGIGFDGYHPIGLVLYLNSNYGLLYVRDRYK